MKHRALLQPLFNELVRRSTWSERLNCVRGFARYALSLAHCHADELRKVGANNTLTLTNQLIAFVANCRIVALNICRCTNGTIARVYRDTSVKQGYNREQEKHFHIN